MGGRVYLSEAFRLGMLLERERWEVGTGTENLGFGENGYTTDTINLHLDIRITVGVTEVGEMRAPGGVLGVPLNDNGVLIKGISESEGGFGLLPGVEIVGLFTSEPIGKRSPDVCMRC